MSLTKSDLRKSILSKRTKLTKDEVFYKSYVILKKIKLEVDLKKKLGIFMPIKNEVDLTALLKKNVALPLVKEEMTFNKYDGELIPGKYNILKTTGAEMELDIVFVPGIVYDKLGYRIGYGKGYYDKYLTNKNVLTIGVCYDFQVVDELPKENHDVKLDILITDKSIYRW
mgnify:CR=1 FL=1